MPTSTLPTSVADPQVAACKSVLQDMLTGLGPRFFDVRFWDGSVWPGDADRSEFTVVLQHAGSLRKMFWPPRPLSLASAYFYGDFDIEGDMRAFSRLAEYLEVLPNRLPLMRKLPFAWRLWRLPHVERSRQGRAKIELSGALHSRERDLQAIRYHYDVSNAFYEKVLDPHMVYTSGIFADPSEDLTAAQERKMDMACRKLRLRAGERLLDIGCGWGGLLIFAAKNYGVRTVGVTLSKPQAEYAQKKILAAGLEERCKVQVLDYRDLDENEPFDKIAILEVAEHFGASQFPTFMGKAWRLLKPTGAMLMQQITQTQEGSMPAAAKEIMQDFIFPDGELLPASFILKQAENVGLELRDIECFREHYILTLERWLANLEANKAAIIAETDEATFRIYRLYFAAARHGFVSNYYNLYQILLNKPDGAHSGLPLNARSSFGA